MTTLAFVLLLVFAAFAVGLGTDQIITGTAVTLGGLGFTGAVYQARFGVTGTALTLPTLSPVEIPILADVPLVGRALFAQAPTAYLAYAMAPLLWFFVFRTEWGLELRAGAVLELRGRGSVQVVVARGGSRYHVALPLL